MVLPLLGHPQESKRVEMLEACGFEVKVAAFVRQYHEGRLPDAAVAILGRIQHGQYLRSL